MNRITATVLMIGFFLFQLTADAQSPQPGLPSDLRTRRTGEDWPSFLGPKRDGRSSETGISAKWPPAGPTVRWQTAVGTGYGTCSVQRGRCLFFDRMEDQARLRCLNSETGELLWEFTYRTNYDDAFGFDNGPRTTPVIDEDRVYIFGVEGKLHCLAVEDGTVIWKTDVVQEFDVVPNFFGVGNTPLVYRELLLVMAGGSPPEDLGTGVYQLDRVTSNGTAIVAFDKRSGKIVYQGLDELASYSSITTANVRGKPVALALARGGLLAFDPETGRKRSYFPWRAKKLESVNASTPVVVDDRVLITESYELGCCQLQLTDGKPVVRWRDPEREREKIMACHWMTPVVHNGFLFGCTDSPAKELRCIDWETGEVKWRRSMERSSLLYADGHLICLGERGMLRLLKADPAAYREVASCDLSTLGYPSWSAPVLSHGLLYVRGASKLMCLELIPER